MIIARIESFILGKDVKDAINRANSYVDAGADGIMIPHVKDVAEVNVIKEAAFYPPLGMRGASGYTRATGYGNNSFEDHMVLSNKNLLLSDKAQINTKPELEIYADDVRCAHGATVAQLDETAKFYLRSRGISALESDKMLSFGFINELLDSMPVEALRNRLRPLLAQQFTTNKALTKHLIEEDFESDA